MLVKNVLHAVYLLAAVLAACLGQFILRIRPPEEGARTTVLYLAASLVCYGASFAITALVLPAADRKLAVLMLSLQYPLLYVFFTIKDAASLTPASVMAISLGYAIVAVGMFGR